MLLVPIRNKLSVQITLSDSEEQLYYDRKGKLRSHHSFERRTNKLYIKNAGKRLRDMSVAVLKIKINSVNTLELYAKNSQTQTLSIKVIICWFASPFTTIADDADKMLIQKLQTLFYQ